MVDPEGTRREVKLQLDICELRDLPALPIDMCQFLNSMEHSIFIFDESTYHVTHLLGRLIEFIEWLLRVVEGVPGVRKLLSPWLRRIPMPDVLLAAIDLLRSIDNGELKNLINEYRKVYNCPFTGGGF